MEPIVLDLAAMQAYAIPGVVFAGIIVFTCGVLVVHAVSK